MKREWKPIGDYEDLYLISDYGEINSLRSRKLLSTKSLSSGYPCVSLCRGGGQKTFRVHRLVAKAFLPNPKGYNVVNHKDGNKLNNHVDNLEWCDTDWNNQHSIETGLKGYKASPVSQYSKEGVWVADFDSQQQAEDKTGICRKQINNCIKDKQKSAHGYVWKTKINDYD